MDVRQVCCEFLQSQLHPTNCLGIRAFADLHTCTQLLNQSHAFAGKPLAMHTAICESSPLAWACMHPWKMPNFVSPRAAFHWGGARRGVPGSVSAASVQPHLQRQAHRFHRGEGQKRQQNNRTLYIYTSLKIFRHLGCIRQNGKSLSLSHTLHPASCQLVWLQLYSIWRSVCACLRMSTGKSAREQLFVILLSEQREQLRWRMVQ